MSAATVDRHDPHHTGDTAKAPHRDSDGPASPRVVVAYGFWIFLLSDIVTFSVFFAGYAVLAGATAGGPSGHELFDLPRVAAQTGLLLMSSFTCGLASIMIERGKVAQTQVWLLVTGLLGAAFLLLEVQEFAQMVGEGAGPSRSAFLSSFFALVGLHGVHVGVGLLWLGTMMAQLQVKGPRADIRRRLLCFALFWHALDITWVAIFTMVYLLGSGL